VNPNDARTGERNDLVPLSDRLAVLLIARLAIAAAVMIAVGLLGHLMDDPSDEVFFAAVVYAGLTTAVEWVRRRLEWRGMLVVSALLVVDGIFLAYVVAQTGGAASLLTFLIYFHIVAVTLVASYRTGLKVAVWHALLMVGSSAAVVSYYRTPSPPPGRARPRPSAPRGCWCSPSAPPRSRRSTSGA
jgi:hypothetical protein